MAVGGKPVSNFALTEGSATLSGALLATFSDPGNPSPGSYEDATDYAATIAWGDGSANDTATIANGGIVNNADGTWSVFGTHTYIEEGTFTITVQLHHDATADPGPVTDTAVVDEPAVIAVFAAGLMLIVRSRAIGDAP